MQPKTSGRTNRRFRISLSTATVLSLVLGVALGLFLGDYARPLKLVGDGFIRLLQMAIIPYIVISLIANIGGLSPTQATSLAGRTGLLLLCFWVLGLVLVFLAPLSFPTLESASFFSTSLVTQSERIDFLGLYIPANPVRSMVDNVIPAVVLGRAYPSTTQRQTALT